MLIKDVNYNCQTLVSFLIIKAVCFHMLINKTISKNYKDSLNIQNIDETFILVKPVLQLKNKMTAV